jgi:hypothetical protein
MPDRVIEVPNSAAIRQARSFLAAADWSVAPGRTVIRFHPAYCHMQPWVLSALAAWALVARRAGVKLSVQNANRAAYAWRFGLQKYLDLDPGVTLAEHEEAGRFIPLRTVSSNAELAKLLADIVPLLHLASEPEQGKAVQYVMSEMVRNALEHARSRDGAIVSAQLYRGEGGSGRRSYVAVGVADAGRGVRQSLSANYNLANDAEAVVKAIQPGITGATAGMYGTPDNAGAGLFFTRNLSEITDRYFALGSGNAMFRNSTAVERPSDSELTLSVNPYPGTIVSVEIGLDRPVDFSSFLADMRKALGAKDETARQIVQEKVRFR